LKFLNYRILTLPSSQSVSKGSVFGSQTNGFVDILNLNGTINL